MWGSNSTNNNIQLCNNTQILNRKEEEVEEADNPEQAESEENKISISGQLYFKEIDGNIHIYRYNDSNKSKTVYYLKCNDLSRKARAKIEYEITICTVPCSIKSFDDHSYVNDEIILQKFASSEITKIYMQDEKMHKYFFKYKNC